MTKTKRPTPTRKRRPAKLAAVRDSTWIDCICESCKEPFKAEPYRVNGPNPPRFCGTSCASRARGGGRKKGSSKPAGAGKADTLKEN